MDKSATDVMQELLFSAVLDAVEALKKASKGLPNNLVRDINALHPNTGLADTSPELQAAIQTSVRSAFTRLQREGYAVADAKIARAAMPPRPPRDPAAGRGPSPANNRPRPPRPDGPRPRPRSGRS